MLAIRTYEEGLPGVRAANPDVRLSVARDPALGEDSVLVVEYPKPTNDPAGRDVWCESERRDWSARRGISFRIKPDHVVKLSVSFFDRNRVAYTTWSDLRAGVVQAVTIFFDEIRPNPYFQRTDAETSAPIDVSEVGGIAFAPHDPGEGRLVISSFVLV
jgi:hypothetical protein